jgi:2-octaprenylphenol hydroxylase
MQAVDRSKSEFDLIVLGGGLVGLTVANLCVQAGLEVVLVEAKTPVLEWPQDSIDSRCSTISRSSQKIFETLSIWDRLVEESASPYRKMVVWDKLGFGDIHFDAAEVGEPDLGHVIENRVILRALWHKLKERAHQNNITTLFSSRPVNLQVTPTEVMLELENKVFLKAKLIIGADGNRSWLRETAKFKTIQRDYHQQALVCTVKTEREHQETAWQRFLPEGPLAFLPLLDPHTSSIVWTSTPEKIQALIHLSEEQFCLTLAHAFDYRLGKILSIGERLSFPLNRLHTKQLVVERVALVGDAAHVIHPLAGQGVNMGLRDADCLAKILSKAKKEHNDIGHYLILRKYERARQGQVLMMIAAMEFFKQTFGAQFSLAVGLRSVGLTIVNKSQYLKKKIISQAMGI